jgi:hypothetical protein
MNPCDFLTSPISLWDELLTTPALDADADITPDIYTSPIMDFSDDFDMPSLFGSSAYEGYDTKEPRGAVSHLRIFPFPTWTIGTIYRREHLSLTTYQC